MIVADWPGNVREDVSDSVFRLRCQPSDFEGRVPRLTFELEANVPNPFNPTTVIGYTLPARTRVMLEVFDGSSRRVRTLVNGTMEAGRHSAEWDGRNAAGRRMSSGVDFYRMRTPQFEKTRRLVLLE